MPAPKFDYFEERGISDSRGIRKKNVDSIDDPVGSLRRMPNFQSSLFAWYHAYALEGREHVDSSAGTWILTHNRVSRYYGDPGREKWPYRDRQSRQIDPTALSPRIRVHHYFRLHSSDECVPLSSGRAGYSLGLEITEDWHSPTDGVISAIPNDAVVMGSHCIGGLNWNKEKQLLEFANSWGVDWGKRGYGAIRPEIIDRFLVECWGIGWIGVSPPISAKSGLAILLWKSSFAGHEVHGREIVDAGTGERIAWCFLVRRGSYLDIEELFVWPTHRKKGFGGILAKLALELEAETKCELRLLVSFADSDMRNRDALLAVMRHLQLHLNPSSQRSIAWIGLRRKYEHTLIEPYIPSHPACMRDKLDPENSSRLYTVWFGTNREPVDEADISKGFLNARGKDTFLGRCEVVVPNTHRFGSVGAAYWKRLLRLSSDEPLRLDKCVHISSDKFWSELRDELESNPCGKDALVYLHGYRNTFAEAAIRAAQLGFDIKVPGVTAFFSWPSLAAFHGYTADEESISASEPAILDFFKDLVAKSGAQKVHVIAHSMGNRGLLRTISHIGEAIAESNGARLGQVVLAAPDVDSQVFTNLAKDLVHFSERTTLYVSPHDFAIGLSHMAHAYASPRVGRTPPVTVLQGIDTVEVPQLNLMELDWHSYFGNSPALLNDMFHLIRNNLAPSDRPRLFPAKTDKDEAYWQLSK